MKNQTVRLLTIDPNKDFMDAYGATLPVAGANADMNRLAALIRRRKRRITSIHVTLDAHHVIDIAHPQMWVDAQGTHPLPFTIISVEDIETGVWRPRNPHARPAVLGGKTILEHVLAYTRALRQGGKFPLIIWPEHCLIGTSGHNIQGELFNALQQWERDNGTPVDYVFKGMNPFTEHYGALQAEVPIANDPSTHFNIALLNELMDTDVLLVAGEALSHCVRNTVDQIVANIPENQIRKIHMLTDCTSPVAKPPGGPDFPAISQAWLKEMEGRGVTLTTAAAFLAA